MNVAGKFFAELRRRHVFRVAAAYAVFSYIIVQVANNYFPALGLPGWALTTVALVSLAGFPVAIALAWFFDLTPEGVKRTASMVFSAPAAPAAPASEAAPERKSIAVLPFQNMSDDPDLEYFSDGMTEELLNALVRIPDLRVAARTSSFAFKGKHDDIRKIADALNVATVLEGSVRRSGTRIRVTAQLINAEDGYHLYSDRFDREMSDVFAIQDEIANAIVRTLELTLSGGSALVRRGTVDLDAYHAYLRGRHFWNQRALPKAIDQFEHAIAIDPEYAIAYTGLADAYTFLGFYGYVPSAQAFVRARAAADRAIAADPALAEAHYSSGLVDFMFAWKFDQAEASFRHALELNPQMAGAHAQLTQLMGCTGRASEAIEAARQATALEPLSALVGATAAFGLLFAGRADLAEQYCRTALEIDPHYVPAFWVLGATLSTIGRHDEAIAACERAVTYTQRNPLTLMWLGHAQANAGKAAEARLTLQELEQRSSAGYVPPACLAWVAGQLGEADRAVDLAIQALREHSPIAPLLRALEIRPFTDDTRFLNALAEMPVPLRPAVTA